VFCLFRHYITHLAAWYDLNDRQRHFTDLVPVKARQSPLLLSAILAFSTASKNPNEPHEMERAAFYHLESIQILLCITRDARDVVSSGEVLAAICLLRSYEIISRESFLKFLLRIYVNCICQRISAPKAISKAAIHS
jgi:hypothetical protein